MTTPKLANLAVTAPKLAGNSVDRASVIDASLTGDDVGRAAGVVIWDPPSLSAGECEEVEVSLGAAGVVLNGQAFAITPQLWSASVTLHAENSIDPGHVALHLCNVTAQALNIGAGPLQWVAFTP